MAIRKLSLLILFIKLSIMFTIKDYYFTIEIAVDGKQMPYINFALIQHSFLQQLVYTQNLQTSNGVKAALLKIENVLSTKVEVEEIWNIEYEAPCYLEIRNDVSIIGDAISQNVDLLYKVKTADLKIMFENWLGFLLKYENNEIPYLVYNFSSR